MALIPPGGDHWIECEWRLHHPDSPCPYSPAFTTAYQTVLGVNLIATVIAASMLVLRLTVMKKQLWRKKKTWLESIDPLELVFIACFQFTLRKDPPIFFQLA